jgi:hypothetical protein
MLLVNTHAQDGVVIEARVAMVGLDETAVHVRDSRSAIRSATMSFQPTLHGLRLGQDFVERFG